MCCTPQTIQGINFTTFSSNYDANLVAIKYSIAACMSNVSVSDIHDLTVSEAVTTSSISSNALRRVTTSSGGVVISYVIAVNNPLLNYADVSAQLVNNVAAGNFDTFLQAAAVIYGSSPALAQATSSTVSTVNLVLGGSSDTNDATGLGLSMAAIIGIVVGGLALLIFLLGYFLCNVCCKSTKVAVDVGPSVIVASTTDSGKIPHAVAEPIGQSDKAKYSGPPPPAGPAASSSSSSSAPAVPASPSHMAPSGSSNSAAANSAPVIDYGSHPADSAQAVYAGLSSSSSRGAIDGIGAGETFSEAERSTFNAAARKPWGNSEKAPA